MVFLRDYVSFFIFFFKEKTRKKKEHPPLKMNGPKRAKKPKFLI
uniref:Uncharacterized protein n=1 Tax=viral metagenome TaxID=1070528 RepID=A0A6C0AUU6_9ZZZZ